MAAYIKTLKDAAGVDIIYPQTKASAVFTEDNKTVESALQEKMDNQIGTQGQLLGFTANNVVGAVEAPTGVDIQISSSQPTNQKTGDFWYEIL